MDEFAIRTDALTRTFPRTRQAGEPAGRRFTALDRVSLAVRPGELFGLLGSNGAGKTTLIKILVTLLAPSSGTAFVDGLDVVSQAQELRPRINMVSGGETSGYGVLTVRENLWLFAQLYGITRSEALKRIDHMLDLVGLADKANAKVSHLSTGQRQKMNFCRGFITEPKVLFLDEPTLGLDVSAARTIRQFLKDWMHRHPVRTLVLTTHYMAEADELCDRIAIIDAGRVQGCDTPAGLKRLVQTAAAYRIRLAPLSRPLTGLDTVPGVQRASVTNDPEGATVQLLLDAEPAVGGALAAIIEQGGRIVSLQQQAATLEDAFLQLVGHGIQPEAAA